MNFTRTGFSFNHPHGLNIKPGMYSIKFTEGISGKFAVWEKDFLNFIYIRLWVNFLFIFLLPKVEAVNKAKLI